MASRLLLALSAVAFLIVGVQGLRDPVALMATVDWAPVARSATSEARASYGGMQLALAAFLALGAWKATWQRPALVLLALLGGSLVAGRALDAILNGLPKPFILGLWGFEGLMGTGAALALGRSRS